MRIRWNPVKRKMEWVKEEGDVVEEVEPVADGQTPEEAEDEIHRIMGDPELRWRAEQLAKHGMTPHQSRALALDRTVDVHWVISRLINRGCDPAVAFDIASGVMAA